MVGKYKTPKAAGCQNFTVGRYSSPGDPEKKNAECPSPQDAGWVTSGILGQVIEGADFWMTGSYWTS